MVTIYAVDNGAIFRRTIATNLNWKLLLNSTSNLAKIIFQTATMLEIGSAYSLLILHHQRGILFTYMVMTSLWESYIISAKAMFSLKIPPSTTLVDQSWMIVPYSFLTAIKLLSLTLMLWRGVRWSAEFLGRKELQYLRPHPRLQEELWKLWV